MANNETITHGSASEKSVALAENRAKLAKEAAFESTALAETVLRISKTRDLATDEDAAAIAAIGRRVKTLGDAIAGAVAPDDGAGYEGTVRDGCGVAQPGQDAYTAPMVQMENPDEADCESANETDHRRS